MSTTTAIRALNELVAEGVVVRGRGRGTFVAERPTAAPVEPLPASGQFLPYEVSPLAVVSARLPTRRMGQQAARLVHERLDGADGPLRHVVLPAPVQVADRGQNTLGVIGARVTEAAGSR